MKKTIAIISLFALLLTAGCGGQDEAIPTITPYTTPEQPAYTQPADATPKAEEKPSPLAQIKTSGGALNMRKEPNTSAEVLKTLNNGQVVQVVKTEGDWCFLNTKVGTGWCAKEYLSYIDISQGFDALDEIYYVGGIYNDAFVYRSAEDDDPLMDLRYGYVRCYYYSIAKDHLYYEACDTYVFDNDGNFISILPSTFSDFYMYDMSHGTNTVLTLEIAPYNFSNANKNDPDMSDIVLRSASFEEATYKDDSGWSKLPERSSKEIYGWIMDQEEKGATEYYYEHFVYQDGYYVKKDHDYKDIGPLDNYGYACYSSTYDVYEDKWEQYIIDQVFDENYMDYAGIWWENPDEGFSQR